MNRNQTVILDGLSNFMELPLQSLRKSERSVNRKMPSNETYQILNQLDQLTARAIEIERIAHNLSIKLVNAQQAFADFERSTENDHNF